MRQRGRLTGVRRTGCALCGLLASAALAAPASTASAEGDRAPHYQPSAPRDLELNSNSGARAGDYTTDGIPDILARNAESGDLRVYPHSGTFDGTRTFTRPVTVQEKLAGPRWVGQADLTKDGLADVLTVDGAGTMRARAHTGTWDGPNTFGEPVVLGGGWQHADLITTADLNGDGFEDVVSHRKGTEKTFVHENTGGISGDQTFKAPEVLATGPSDDKQLAVADVTADDVPDLIAKRPNGELEIFSFVDGGKTFTIGYGWDIIGTIVVADVNSDGKPDLLGVRDGKVFAYPHTGRFDPNKPAATYGKPVEVVADWTANDVIS